MDEIAAILDAWGSGTLDPDAILATVVHVKGSAYRRPGARMLIMPDGRRIGSISGGCLESDASRKAWWYTADGQPSVRTYDTSSEDDAVWEFGLGCHGVIHVLFERLAHAQDSLAFLRECRATRQPGVIATVVAGDQQVGARLFIDASGSICGGSLQGSPLEQTIRRQALLAIRERRSHFLHIPSAHVFLEYAKPRQRVVIFGAGHDAVPVVTMCGILGWEVTVADGRASYAKADRFPEAASVHVLPPSADISRLAIGPDTAVVLMTHNFPQDVRLLQQILPLKPCYLGLLGPAKRTERLFDELNDDPRRHNLQSPMGLDIGGDAPEAIGVSIVAEIQATLYGRAGAMLKFRKGSIHPQVSEEGNAAWDVPSTSSESVVCELANIK